MSSQLHYDHKHFHLCQSIFGPPTSIVVYTAVHVNSRFKLTREPANRHVHVGAASECSNPEQNHGRVMRLRRHPDHQVIADSVGNQNGDRVTIYRVRQGSV
eukprot:SAG11_NODE_3014_length_2762_cov_1.890349_2_plen_101_part_00